MKVLITGGAGYIGSTVCSALEDAGHTPVVLDSLVTGREEFTKGRIFYKGDIADTALVGKIFAEHPDIVYAIHFAALVVVFESVADPYSYYYENVVKSLILFKKLIDLGCKGIVFSSSASIYDAVPSFVVNEQSPLKPSSPYARTKFMMEMVLQDLCAAYGIHGIALRYFNPIGADPKMRSGIHVQYPSHVIGKLVSTASGVDSCFSITGTDWPTRDGTGLRDYIHVWDLAQAHVCAVEKFTSVFEKTDENYVAINLGTGRGVTVKELVEAFERVYGKELNKKLAPPRPGDVAGACANADTALRLLGWKAEKSIDEGIADTLKWMSIRESIIHYN